MLILASALLLTACAPSRSEALRAADPHPPPASAAAIYHLDCSAHEDGDGSPGSPWNSPDSVAAHGAFAPGSSVLLRRGTRCTGRIVPTGSGTPGRPDVLGAYGSGQRPIVDGNGTPDLTGAVELRDVHDWVVQDLDVTNAAVQVDRTFRAGILVRNDAGGVLADITVRRNLVHGVTSSPGSWTADPHSYGGIAVIAARSTDGSPRSFTGLRISDNTVDDVGRSGITVWSEDYSRAQSTDVVVDHNVVHRAQGDSILLLGVDGGLIEHNSSVDGGFLPACPGCVFTAYNTANAGIWPTRSRHVLMRFNEVSGENDAGGDGEGLDVDQETEDVVVEFNYSHDNQGGGILICGAAATEVRYNVFRGDGGGEITFSCPTQGSGIRIHHNVVDSRPGTGAAIVRTTQGSGASPVLFADNIVADGSGGGYHWPAPVVSAGNHFSGAHPSDEPSGAADLRGEWPFVVPPTTSSGLESLSGYQARPDSGAATPGAQVGESGPYDLLGASVPGDTSFRGAVMPAGGGRQDVPPAAPTGAVAHTTDGMTTISWAVVGGLTYQLVRRSAGREVVLGSSLLRGSFTDRGSSSPAVQYGVEARSPTGVPSRIVWTPAR